MNTCKHARVKILELTYWQADREQKTSDIVEEEWDTEWVMCMDCGEELHTSDIVAEAILIIEEGRGNT
jgi:hypothetical protein